MADPRLIEMTLRLTAAEFSQLDRSVADWEPYGGDREYERATNVKRRIQRKMEEALAQTVEQTAWRWPPLRREHPGYELCLVIGEKSVYQPADPPTTFVAQQLRTGRGAVVEAVSLFDEAYYNLAWPGLAPRVAALRASPQAAAAEAVSILGEAMLAQKEGFWLVSLRDLPKDGPVISIKNAFKRMVSDMKQAAGASRARGRQALTTYDIGLAACRLFDIKVKYELPVVGDAATLRIEE